MTPEEQARVRAERVAKRRAEREAEEGAIRAARRAEHLAERLATALAKEKEEAAALRLRQLARVEEVDGLPRVLLIGDSISMGYTLQVRDLLPDANVQRIPNNGSDTGTDLARIPRWLTGFGPKPWDVIHYNSGVHDALCAVPGVPNVPNVSLEQYAANLREIVTMLKATGAKLIFATTTPTPANSRFADSATYNAVAVPIMQENGIAINDLYSLVRPRISELMPPDNPHFLPNGYDVLAAQVAASIAAQLT